MSGIMMAVGSVSGIGLVAAVILVIASKVMEVPVDERIETVREELPSANCGACGYAGCDDYAKAVVEEGAALNLCTPGGPDTAAKIADIMGGEAGEMEKTIAMLRCQGTVHHTTKKYDYAGVSTCRAAAQMYGGNSSCSYSCLGFGDCVSVCEFDAMEIVDGIVKIDADKCTACGACVEECPKMVLELRKVGKTAFVQCSNEQKGAQSRKVCSISCIACTKCVKVCPVDAIMMKNNRAVIDPDKCINCGDCVEVCPTNAINLV